MVDFRTVLNDLYLDYINNYLTIEKFAELNGLTEDEALTLIAIGRRINNREYV